MNPVALRHRADGNFTFLKVSPDLLYSSTQHHSFQTWLAT